MTTENWLTLSGIIITVTGSIGMLTYRVIMRDVKALIKEHFSMLREEKIKELAEENIRKDAKISRLQDSIREMN